MIQRGEGSERLAVVEARAPQAHSRICSRPEAQLLGALIRTTDVLRNAIEGGIRPWSVSLEQCQILTFLQGARGEGLPTHEIARGLASLNPNVTRTLDKLVAKGLARRDRSGQDRRVVVNRITSRGRRVVQGCEGAFDAILDRLHGFSGADAATLTRLLENIRTRVGEAPKP